MPVEDNPSARLSAIQRGAPVEVVADVVGGRAVQHGFDAGAVAVVHKAGTRRAAYGRQAVLGVRDASYLTLFPVVPSLSRVSSCIQFSGIRYSDYSRDAMKSFRLLCGPSVC